LERGLLPQAGGDPCCRVQRFVDGGPNNPGAARASGSIRPGDVVVAVNGSPVKTYEQTISVLKKSINRREITFQSAWNDISTPKKSNGNFPGILRRTLRTSSFDLSPVTKESEEKNSIRGSIQKSRSEVWNANLDGMEGKAVLGTQKRSPTPFTRRAGSLDQDEKSTVANSSASSKRTQYTTNFNQSTPLLLSPSLVSMPVETTSEGIPLSGNKNRTSAGAELKTEAQAGAPMPGFANWLVRSNRKFHAADTGENKRAVSEGTV
jgi:hypothetical protein